MDTINPTTESTVRLTVFFGVLVVMSVWEVVSPRRKLNAQKGQRWFTNLSLLVLNSVIQRLVLPLSAIVCAELTGRRGWGLLNGVNLPGWLEVLLAVLVLDMIIYLQHVIFHHVPILWRLHMVHHVDLDFDVTTGIRFHTLEILLSAGLKLLAIVFLGPSPLAVLLFEVILNGMAMFNHSNVKLPLVLDRSLRWLVVTPDMHRVHHSVIRKETNSNFGFNLPWWDYLFRTYTAQPQAGHEGMTIGLEEYREEKVTSRLDRVLVLPVLIRIDPGRKNGD